MRFANLPGFREYYPDACALRNHIFGQWRKAARAFCFAEYDAPVLEPLELYVEKSGEEIVEQLFRFEDRGGREVALRPEMTPSLARLVGARANSLKRPVKWFSVGEQYRYERPQKGRLRSFYQFNADILGEPGYGADAELILLLARALDAFGLGAADYRIRLSDRDLWLLLLAAEGLNERDSSAVLGVVDKMERIGRGATLEKLAAVVGDSAERLLGRIDAMVGVRDLAALDALLEGLDLDAERAAAARQRREEWAGLLRLLEAGGIADRVSVDLGVVRGLAYYTGFVFEAFEAEGRGRALAGGGRYDGLVAKLGGPDLPAAGFAMGDVTLIDLLEAKGLAPAYIERPDCVAVVAGEAGREAAVADAADLRAMGLTVDYPLKPRGFGKQFKEAGRSGARLALIYGEEELAAGSVKVRDLTSGNERVVARAELAEAVPEWLARGVPEA